MGITKIVDSSPLALMVLQFYVYICLLKFVILAAKILQRSYSDMISRTIKSLLMETSTYTKESEKFKEQVRVLKHLVMSVQHILL